MTDTRDTRIERLQRINPELVESFLKKRESQCIPEDLQDYIIKLDAVPQAVHFCGASMSRVVKELQRRFRDLTYAQARDLYYNGMNFFNIENNVSAEAWDNYYADKLESLAQLSVKMDKLDTARRCFERAHKYRIEASERIKPEEWKAPVFIISNRISHKDLGYEKKSILDIQRKDEDGYYIKLINSLDIPDKEKKRLMVDANVVDVDYEDIDENGEDI